MCICSKWCKLFKFLKSNQIISFLRNLYQICEDILSRYIEIQKRKTFGKVSALSLIMIKIIQFSCISVYVEIPIFFPLQRLLFSCNEHAWSLLFLLQMSIKKTELKVTSNEQIVNLFWTMLCFEHDCKIYHMKSPGQDSNCSKRSTFMS